MEYLTAAEINDLILGKYPFVYRNNRGAVKTQNGYIRFGIPEPPSGRKERDFELKGGDSLGFHEVIITPDMVGKTISIFTNVEIKAYGDRLKDGQINWHNFVLSHGGTSEIWAQQKNGEIEIITDIITL